VTRESDHGYTTERWDLQGAPGHPRHRLLLGTAVARRPLATDLLRDGAISEGRAENAIV
jgi:hypothetical protein